MDRNVFQKLLESRLGEREPNLFFVSSFEDFKHCVLYSMQIKKDMIALYKGTNESRAKEIEFDSARRWLDEHFPVTIHVALLSLEKPIVNLADHTIVPKIKLLRKGSESHPVESNNLLVEGNQIKSLGSIFKLPKILTTDPLCNWYGFRHGDLIEVDGKDLYVVSVPRLKSFA